jgi:mycofactocin precursor
MAENAVLLDPPPTVANTAETAASARAEHEPARQADAAASQASEPAEVLASDLLVEEISIDGMCGVY